MSDMKRVNPEVVKKAAELAFPAFAWQIGSLDKVFAYYPDYGVKIFDLLYGENELVNNHCFVHLERALKKEGWHFSWSESFDFCASNGANGFQVEMDPSDTLLLLKCVSAMTSLPLYAEESMG